MAALRAETPGATVAAGVAADPVAATTGGQRAPPPHLAVRQAQNRSGQNQVQSNQSNTSGRPTDAPRGKWGDDGFDAYGVGQHRGSSSAGGGRGYAWQSDGSAERPFLGPAGGFVEGASGPDNRHRGGYRGYRGRGGGRGRFRRPPPPRHVDSDGAAMETDQTPQELPPQAMEVVNALAVAEVPGIAKEAEVVQVADSERASKYARKKERMLCYRCGEKGHFIAECVAQLCESCGKPAHASGDCPLLRDHIPALTVYGVYCAELMFFESAAAREIPADTQSLTSGLVKVTQGDVSQAQIVQRLQELAPGDFQWDLVPVEDRVFRVEFPSIEDLQRLLSFGMCKVPGTKGILEFHEWKKVEPKGKPLTQVWLRFSGAPSEALSDVRVVASLGIMVGKTEKVDMAFTRAQGVARLRVSILDIEYVPDVINWTYRGEVFPLDIEFEDAELFAEVAAGTDVDMHDGGDDTGAPREQADEAAQEPNGSGPAAQEPENGAGMEQSPASSLPHNSLRFGSFLPSSAPPRLWSDRVDSDDAFEHSLPVLDFGRSPRQSASFSARVVQEVEPQESPGRSRSSVSSRRGGASGQVATTPSHSSVSQQAAQVPVSSRGDISLGQEALEVRLAGASLVVGSPEVLGRRQGQVAPDPLVPTAVLQVERTAATASAGGVGLGQEALVPTPSGISTSPTRSPSPRPTPGAATREEVIAFGGIRDPASEGRRTSSRLQDLPEVDDLQQRCAMRAAKLRDVESTTGYLPSNGSYPFLVATHSDGGQGAFGYCCYPMGDGSSGYIQPVWMAVV
ncbi:uncharacterized protein [Triticum aestivum]|nr:uncharacterized protein LOC123119326 [Triticum aestivum]XP_044459649.1 uncharacterized protein LOC123190980 [Triticum aestivum]